MVVISYVHWGIETVKVENGNGEVTGCSHVTLLSALGTQGTHNETKKGFPSSEFGLITSQDLDKDMFQSDGKP